MPFRVSGAPFPGTLHYWHLAMDSFFDVGENPVCVSVYQHPWPLPVRHPEYLLLATTKTVSRIAKFPMGVRGTKSSQLGTTALNK